jgi:HSP20 family protein
MVSRKAPAKPASKQAAPKAPAPTAAPQAPRHPLMSFRSQMDSLFDDFFKDWGVPHWGLAPSAERLMPRVDLREDDKNVVVVADLPGVDEKDIELYLDDNVLSIRAERKEESEKKDDDKTSYHRIERSYGMIQRSIPMPCPVKQDGIAAAFAKGVLTVTLPKDAPAAPKAKRIAVKAA